MRLYAIFSMLACLCILSGDRLYAETNQDSELIRPPIREGIIKVPPTLKTDPLTSMRMGTFEVKFEETTLGAVINEVGVGSIQLTRETGESQYYLCYSLPDQHQRIWLISNGEMGGPDHALTQVYAVSTIKPIRKNVACPQIPSGFQSISMKFGWLGTTHKKLLTSLGKPSGSKDGRLIFLYEGEKTGIYQGKSVEFDVITYIEAQINDNKISSLYISHVTTY